MTCTYPVLASTVLMAALTGACSQGAATAESSAEDASGTEAIAAGQDATAPSTDAAASADMESVAAAAAPSPEPKEVAVGAAKSLPLKRGFYIDSDTPCGQASNATLRLVTRTGINFSQGICTFKKIERTGPTSFRVTEACSSGGAAWGVEEQIETSPVTYEIPNESSFTIRYEGGSVSSARYCAQSSLPEPWRNNDISDLIG